MRLHYLLLLMTLVCGSHLWAQTEVTGTVSQGETDNTLVGVAIVEKGTTNGTLSDADGNFTLTVNDPNATLVLSYYGYSSQEVAIAGRTQLAISMEEDIANLDEVVVVGYGVQKKALVTGAISKVRSEDIEDMPVPRIEQSLQGRTSGVRVTTNSGQPGEASTVRIRGTSSINASDPLYVVDGVIVGGGIDYLNQNDIESIEVLKDAASASIYGARSASGVILVTTKSGSQGRVSVNYNGYYGTQAPWRKLALLNGTEYATLMNESSLADGGGIIYDDPQSFGEGTDWQDAVFNNSAPIQNHSLSISAGSKKSSTFFSVGYFDQDGIISDRVSRYDRLTVRYNSTVKINDRIKFGNNLGYSRITAQGISANSEFGGALSRAVNLDPLTPVVVTDPDVASSSPYNLPNVVRDENGNPYGISPVVTSEVLNPVAAFQIQQNRGYSDKFVGNAFVEIEPIDGLTFRSSIGTDLAFFGGEGFTPLFYLNAANTNTVTSLNRANNRGFYWIFQNTLTYARVIGRHDFSILVGNVAEENAGQGISGTIQNLPERVTSFDDAYFNLGATPDNQFTGGFEYQDRLSSYLGRINYNYDGKYLFTATLRADGSSRFGPNNQFGFFPAVSAGWVLTAEDFLLNNSAVNFLKIRASWGVNGNDQIGTFRYTSTLGQNRNYTFGLNDILTNGVSPNAIANPDLRWEETQQINFGIDAKLLRNVSLTLDYFEKETTDMLLDIAVPSYVGNGGPTGNIAEMVNRGVEAELGYARKFGDVDIDIAGNVTYIENEVTSLGPDKEFLPGQTFSTLGLQITRTEVGLPIGYFYGFQTDGIFQNAEEVAAYTGPDGELIQPNARPGDFRFVDIDGDGVLTETGDQTFIGDPTPTWTYGFNATFEWKGIDLVIFGQGVGGNQLYRATRRFDLQRANLTADALDRWTGEGSTNAYPRLSFSDPNRNFSQSSDFYVEDGDFFRIKTLQLGYNFPRELLKPIGMTKLRVYVSGNNLVTFTRYSGFDPEIGGGSFGVDRGIYPQARFYLVGLNLSF